jgi:hypothetical protein
MDEEISVEAYQKGLRNIEAMEFERWYRVSEPEIDSAMRHAQETGVLAHAGFMLEWNFKETLVRKVKNLNFVSN